MAKYDLWVVEQHKKESELMTILQTDVSDDELRVVLDGVIDHYQDLFWMKADAAKVVSRATLSRVRRQVVGLFGL